MPLFKSILRTGLSFSFMSLFGLSAQAEESTLNLDYQKAPPPLDRVLEAPFLPAFSVAPNQQTALLLEQRTWPGLAELAEPELRLAGLRINPQNFAPSRNWYYTGMTLKNLNGAAERPVQGLPAQARLSNIHWSPNSRWVAFTQTSAQAVSLWVLDVAQGQARQLSELPLNKSYGPPFVWDSDSHSLLIKVPTGEIPLPPADHLPNGPVIMESLGQASPGRTYQDLLKSPQDEARFKHYLHSQLLRIQLNGQSEKVGKAALIIDFEPSPDGQYLLVKQLHEPFSYHFPASRFPLLVEVWSPQGQLVKEVTDLPLADKIPLSFDAARPGRRHVAWREDAPASLYWARALDEGDPTKKVSARDRLMLWPAPFDGEPRKLLEVPNRIERVDWGHDQLALVYTGWYQTRQSRVWMIQPAQPELPARKVLEYSSENQYLNPGQPLLKRTPQGTSVLLTAADGQTLFLRGQGASPDGEKPFLDRWNLETGERTRAWQSQPPYYEQVVQVLDTEALQLITRREAQQQSPNYFVRELTSGKLEPLTQFPHPFPDLAKIQKQIISYKRADGLDLNATLYVPAGYEPKQGPLPTVLWAYPREFKTAQAAGQVKGSPHSFTRISPSSPLVFLTQGYAVLEPNMPIIGTGQAEPNDTYIQQLVAGAEAAVQKVTALGVTDPERVAVGGHSYGAFMTANLLAHSNLFRAGIARSGAYNRTLTPFGFQAEQRTYWQAPEVYERMSPMMNADKIKAPLLLIHGEADNNSGTYPMQSEYFYQALKGLGAPVRFVLLPHESHGYQARESLGHSLWEMVRWLDTHVKNAPPR